MSQYLPKKPGAIPLIAALAANSHFLYANIGVMTAGMVPYILNQSSPPHPREVAKSMNWFIETAKVGCYLEFQAPGDCLSIRDH